MIEVTYRVTSSSAIDLSKKAKAIALGQTTEAWTPTARAEIQKLKKHTGVVLATSPLPDGGLITVGFPEANTERDIPSLLTMIFGKISMDGRIRLEKIVLPPKALMHRGPRFGIPGMRRLLKKPSVPLSMAIFKPCVGLSPKELGEMFYELAMGGLDIVKDDEILPDLPICPVEKRLEACLVQGERAYRETQRRTLYAINLTGRPSQLLTKAQRLKKLGAQCFLFNVLSYGFGVLEELTDVGVPLMAHPALAGAMAGSTEIGIAYSVLLGTLMRRAGADIVLFPSSYGTVRLTEDDTHAIRTELTKPNVGIKPSFPVPSAGIHPGIVPRMLADYGNDVIVNAGGGVSGHPQGLRAGAMAFRQAINAALAKKDFATLSSAEAPELVEALNLWGRG